MRGMAPFFFPENFRCLKEGGGGRYENIPNIPNIPNIF